MSLTHNSLSSLFSDIATSIRNKTGESSLIKADNFPTAIDNISTGGGGNSYIIRVYEFSGLTIEIYDSSSVLKEAKTSPGGLNEFQLSTPGTYIVKVKNGNDLVWSKDVTITECGVYIVKGRTKSEEEGGTAAEREIKLTMAELDVACQGGYAKYMFNLRDTWKPITTTDRYKNFPCYIQHFWDDGSIQFGIVAVEVSSVYYTYVMNDYYRYCATPDATTSKTTTTNAGGYKYSYMRRYFMLSGDEVYSIASGIKNNGSSLSGLIEFDALKYSDTNQKANIYTYNISNDTFDVATTMGSRTNENPYFVKGYWKTVKDLTEEQFNSSTWYTYSDDSKTSYGYSLATTYDPSKRYYGFYEFIQEDGYFCNQLSDVMPYLQYMELKQSAGGKQTQYGTVCYDKVTINSLGELFGMTYSNEKADGSAYLAQYGDPVNCHNEKFDGVKYFDMFDNSTTTSTTAAGMGTWTRSTNASSATSYCLLHGYYGYIYTSTPDKNQGVHMSFRFK